jgi:tRNA dimethylallyltransferase
MAESDKRDYVTEIWPRGRPVIVAGPTASGKSELAVRLAERDGGCVINADASQVYACWRVLTARPGPAEVARAPHALYGHVTCDARYSVGAWLRDVAAALADARARALRPVIVGGTGLYLSTLTEGLADIPEIPPEVRERSQAMLRSGTAAMLAELERRDPATFARIDRDNPVRVQRAWEVLTATGRGLSDWHRAPRAPLLPASKAVCLVVHRETSILNNWISDIFNKMLEDGALDECRAFLAAGHDAAAPAGRVLGAEPLVEYLGGRLTLDAAIEAAVTATRQFAKRQRTWFRNRMRSWPRVDPAGDALATIPER